MRDCLFFPTTCYIVRIFSSDGKVAITDSSWKNSISSAAKALMISNAGGKTDVLISGCTFVVNAKVHVRNAVRIRAHKVQAKGSVLIENSIFPTSGSPRSSRSRSSRWCLVDESLVPHQTYKRCFNFIWVLTPNTRIISTRTV